MPKLYFEPPPKTNDLALDAWTNKVWQQLQKLDKVLQDSGSVVAPDPDTGYVPDSSLNPSVTNHAMQSNLGMTASGHTMSAGPKLLGRSSTSAGAVQEISATSGGLSLLTTSGIGTASGSVADGSRGVAGGDTHDHTGGSGAQIDHTELSNIGSNTHAQIDTFMTEFGSASNYVAFSSGGSYPGSPVDGQIHVKADGEVGLWSDLHSMWIVLGSAV
jgi:hypothetical protein